MSASNLLDEIEKTPRDQPFDWPDFSQRLNEEFGAATSSVERSDLLAVRAVAIELVMRQLDLHADKLEKFLDACELEYKRLIVQETLVDGHVSYEEMLHVTDREIAAGRMSDDYALRVIAVEESPNHARIDTPPEPANSASTTTSRFAKLKHWLHID